MKWLQANLSQGCSGGPVLVLTLLCLGFGVLFLLLSASPLGFTFIAVGALTEGLCLYLGRTRCGESASPRG